MAPLIVPSSPVVANDHDDDDDDDDDDDHDLDGGRNCSSRRNSESKSCGLFSRRHATSSIRPIISHLLLGLLLFILPSSSPSVPFFASASGSSGAASSKNYNVYQYDRTTPQFTPDGRLLQVEYASTAADLSPPLIVVECKSPHDASLILLTIPKQAMSPQQRIVIVEEDGDGSSSSNHGFCLAMSGSLADSLALLQVGLKRSAQHRLQYGSEAPVGMAALARALADECQSRVMGGGLRPYGSTLLLCGYDDDGPSRGSGGGGGSGNQAGVIYQTDPSGGILQHGPRPTAAEQSSSTASTTTTPFVGKNKPRSGASSGIMTTQVRCIVGGSPSLQRQLHKRIQQGMAKFERGGNPSTEVGESETTIAQRIATLAKILLKETEGKIGEVKKDGSGITPADDVTSLSGPRLCPLEVVVVSSRSGCHRLDEHQIRFIQKLIADMP